MGRTREGAVFRLRVQPHARRQEVVGVRGEALAVKVTAPAEGGQANEACCAFLARLLGVPRSKVAVVGGHTFRSKLVRAEGVTAQDVLSLLGRA